MPTFKEILAAYDYSFPKEHIAESPASPRDSAKLLVYDRKKKKVQTAIFKDILDFLPKNAVLVVNRTKVIPANLHLTKATGGKVSALILNQEKGLEVMANKKLTIGETLTLTKKHRFTVTKSNGKSWLLKPDFPAKDLHAVIENYGSTPLPPYLKHSPLSEAKRKREYQTVFAKDEGSIAAPTASLHFTKPLLKKLQKNGIKIVEVTLHVHLGTFAPLTEEQWKQQKLHSEYFEISEASQKALNEAKKQKRSVVAVGTTVVRTLESASDAKGKIQKRFGDTKLFLTEKSTIKVVDGLITNFHVPRSSLLMLVSAFVGRKKLMELYTFAMKKNFRFFSFGDAMLII